MYYVFLLRGGVVTPFTKTRERKLLTRKGCNEPFKDRFWCPEQEWFMTESCPFINRHECKNFKRMTEEKFVQMEPRAHSKSKK